MAIEHKVTHTSMEAAIAAHRAAWEAFQVHPDTTHTPGMMKLLDAECEVYFALLTTAPKSQADLAALKAHLDWWVVEEAQRRNSEPEIFALHATITLALQAGRDSRHPT